MAVDNPDVVDAVGTERDTGSVVLTIADHLPWDGDEHLLALQSKINRYLDFIESGQLKDEYPSARPEVPIRIEVACKYPPSTDALKFLEVARETIMSAGWGFSWYCPTHESNPPSHSGKMVEVPQEITRFYQETAEGGRLSVGPGQLEFAQTKEVVLRSLPPAPATVLDVGGAAGVYSLWLAGLGYQVHLIDAVPRHVEEAERRNEAAANRIQSCRVGDARELPFEDGVADAVLLLGPLYHLPDAADRQLALREVFRVLRPGGVMFAAAISRCASALDGIARDLFADPTFAAIVRQDLETGQHRNETNNLDYFTTAYFHRPEELRGEVAAAGFRCDPVVGLEGPGWMFADFAGRWANTRKREDLLHVARDLEREESIVGLSAHLLCVGVKSGRVGRSERSE